MVDGLAHARGDDDAGMDADRQDLPLLHISEPKRKY